MSGLFSQVFSLGAEPVYPGNEFSFPSSYSRGKQPMSNVAFCNSSWRIKRFLYIFFPVHLHRNLRWHKSFLYRDLAGCLLQVAWCWPWFHDSLILCCCTSLEILSLVLPIRFFLFLMSSNRLKQLLQTPLWSSFTNGNCTVVWSIAFKALNSTEALPG